MRTISPNRVWLAPLAALSLALPACGGDEASVTANDAAGGDPLLARALNDPLMVDPDLAYRNEANAALTIRHDWALPRFAGTREAAERAREVARLELLETGPIQELPAETTGEAATAFLPDATAQDMLAAADAPQPCAAGLSGGLSWAARMPELAQVMPHGMVQQAAGSDAQGCTVRVVRYLTPVAIADALQYHFNHAARARLSVTRMAEPEAMLVASRANVHFIVHARPAEGGMNAVDLLYWQREAIP